MITSETKTKPVSNFSKKNSDDLQGPKFLTESRLTPTGLQTKTGWNQNIQALLSIRRRRTGIPYH